MSFSCTVSVVGYSRGRSAANIDVQEVGTENYYTIFLTDFMDMLKHGDLQNGQISGEFIVRKRGRNFGIRLKSTPRIEDSRDYAKTHNYPVPAYL